MKYKIHKNNNTYDHDSIEFIGTPFKGNGFIGHDDKAIGLTRCPICGKENYAGAVIDGVCAWCGFSVHDIN
jgi:ribosomal protein L37E